MPNLTDAQLTALTALIGTDDAPVAEFAAKEDEEVAVMLNNAAGPHSGHGPRGVLSRDDFVMDFAPVISPILDWVDHPENRTTHPVEYMILAGLRFMLTILGVVNTAHANFADGMAVARYIIPDPATGVPPLFTDDWLHSVTTVPASWAELQYGMGFALDHIDVARARGRK